MVFSRRALRARSCTTGSAGPRRSTTRVTGAPARRDRPVDDLGPHPPDRPGDRPRDGPADRAGHAALPRAPGLSPRRSRPDVEGLTLRLLGNAEAHLDGRRLLLNRRQTEILALLAMNPDGVSLERLHALVYGDQGVTLSTLKAEVSHLRSALGGQLTSRPYRLTMPVTTDIDVVLAAVRRGDVARRAGGVRRRPAARHQLARAGRAGGVRRGGRPRGAAGRPAARGRGPLQRARAVRRGGDRGLPGPPRRPRPTPPSPCSRAASPSPGRLILRVMCKQTSFAKKCTCKQSVCES